MLSYSTYIPPPDDDFNTIKHCISLSDSEAYLDGKYYYYDKKKDTVYQWDSIGKRIHTISGQTRERLLQENQARINEPTGVVNSVMKFLHLR